MSAFTEVRVEVDGEAAEAVAEVLRPFAYQEGVVLEQRGDEKNLDPAALEPVVTVNIFIPREEDALQLRQRIEEILYHLNRLYPVPAPSFLVLEETDWADAWKAHYRPFRVGKRFWIKPTWLSEQSNLEGQKIEQRAQDLVIELDPGMAFGTGLHPTTQMCLQALEEIVQPGDSVLDVGTGSGILAIAARKLGAVQIVGVDTDEMAVKSAVENAKQNGIIDNITFLHGSLQTVSDRNWHVVVVNILAPVIQELLTDNDLLGYIGDFGWLLLSGIIDSQVAELEDTIKSKGGVISRKLKIRDWETLLVRSVKSSN